MHGRASGLPGPRREGMAPSSSSHRSRLSRSTRASTAIGSTVLRMNDAPAKPLTAYGKRSRHLNSLSSRVLSVGLDDHEAVVGERVESSRHNRLGEFDHLRQLAKGGGCILVEQEPAGHAALRRRPPRTKIPRFSSRLRASGEDRLRSRIRSAVFAPSIRKTSPCARRDQARCVRPVTLVARGA